MSKLWTTLKSVVGSAAPAAAGALKSGPHLDLFLPRWPWSDFLTNCFLFFIAMAACLSAFRSFLTFSSFSSSSFSYQAVASLLSKSPSSSNYLTAAQP